ncbi:type II secretion system protein GspD [Photobacterium leiognathi]|uniref:type II secretion system protein GspD n=1 Tax=Photobacterium leiognathi TaxID=553611 RepID=UPI002981C3A0|nr:type II and III secretion system protein [Photobacterium leiognathi]
MKTYIVNPLCMALMVSLSGCVSQDYIDTKKEAVEVQNRITQLTPSSSMNNVAVITRPPINTTPLPRNTMQPWLNQTVQLQVKQLPLSLVLNEVLRGAGISVWFDSDVDATQRVSITANASRENIFNLLSSQTGYGFVTTRDSVEVRRYLSETFTLSVPNGVVSAQQGSQGESSGNEDNTKVEGQFINTTYNNIDVIAEVQKAISGILKSEKDSNELVGSVNAIPSLSSVTVRTTPDRMRQVRNVVESFQAELSKQVLLDIRILEFRSNLGKDRGIDWNVVRDIGSGSLQFVIPGTTTTASSAGYGLAFQGTGKWDGTTAFIKALEQQGTVSTETPINILTLNNHPARLSQDLKTPYLSDIKVDSNEQSTSTETQRGKETEGVDMMVTANVKDEHVWLRIAGKLTKIAGDTTETVADAKLRFISTRGVDLSFTNKLRYGQTVVIGSIKQQTTGATKSSSFGLDGLGSQATNRETVETLILLTPRKVQ